MVDGEVVPEEPSQVQLVGDPDLAQFASSEQTSTCGSEFLEVEVDGESVTIPAANHALNADGTRLAYLRSSEQPSGECEQSELVVRDVGSGSERVWDAYFPELVSIEGENGPEEVSINGGGIVTQVTWSQSDELAYGTYDARLWVLDPDAPGLTIRDAVEVRERQVGWQHPAWMGDQLVVTGVGESSSPMQIVDKSNGSVLSTLASDSLHPIGGDPTGEFLLYLRGDPEDPELVVRTETGAERTMPFPDDAFVVYWSE